MTTLETVITAGVIVAIGWCIKNHITAKQIKADFAYLIAELKSISNQVATTNVTPSPTTTPSK